jgi:uncharacterized protein
VSLPTDALLRDVLTRSRTIACVGASLNQNRPSFQVGSYLCRNGYRVIPVNPGQDGKILFGETVVPRLSAIPEAAGPVHMVDVFRRSEEAGRVVDEALEVLLDRGLICIWMQIGVSDAAAAARAEAKGVRVVMNRCPKIDYARLFGDAPRDAN